MQQIFMRSLLMVLLGTVLAMAQRPEPNPCGNKDARTLAQRKISSALLCEIYPVASRARATALERDDEGRVRVDIRALDLATVSARVSELQGKVVSTAEPHHAMQAYLPLSAVQQLAELPAVRFINVRSRSTTHDR